MRIFNEAEPPWSNLSEILGLINVLPKFENDPWKIMDVRVLTGLVCPAARLPARPPARSGYDNTPEPLRAAGKINCKMLSAKVVNFVQTSNS